MFEWFMNILEWFVAVSVNMFEWFVGNWWETLITITVILCVWWILLEIDYKNNNG